MNFSPEALTWSVIAGLFSWQVLMPMVRHIPYNLERGWHQEAENYTGTNLPANYSAPEPLPNRTRLAFVLLSALISFVIFTVRGVSTDTVFIDGYMLCMLLLAFINVETQLLPDQVSLTALWIGLVYQSLQGKGADQISGAAVGFMVPYIASFAIRIAAKKEFIGVGDMKVFGMAGAWLGLYAMPTIFSVFAISVFITGIGAELTKEKMLNGFISTGPMHFFASFCVVLGLNLGSPWH